MRGKRIATLALVWAGLFAAISGALAAPAQPQPNQPAEQPHILASPLRPRAASSASGAQLDVKPAARMGAIAPGPLLAARAESPAIAETQYIYEGFENWPNYIAGGNWVLRDFSSDDSGEYFWGTRDCSPYLGDLAGFPAGAGQNGKDRECTSPYPRMARSWAFLGPFDLRDFVGGSITLFIKGRSEWNFNAEGRCFFDTDDYTFFGAAASSSPNTLPNLDDVYGWCQAGDFSSGYEKLTYNLGLLDVLGKTNVFFGLYFSSDDDDTRFAGLSIDELIVTLETAPSPAPGGNVYLPIANKPSPPPPVVNCPDTEPNNDAPQAKAITVLGQPCVGSFQTDNDDWYKVTVNAGKQLVIDVTGLPSGADYDLYLFDQSYLTGNRQFVAKSDATGTVNERIVYSVTKTQTFFIRTFGYKLVADKAYRLQVSVN